MFYLTNRIDFPTVVVVMAICLTGVAILYSASSEDMDLVTRQGYRIGLAVMIMLALAFIPTDTICRLSPYIYLSGLALLIAVLVFGTVGKGAQRWIDLGGFRFQPAELMKIAVPLAIAWLLTRPPLVRKEFYIIFGLIGVMIPVLLVYMQPDLGTALLIAAAGVIAIFFGGLAWRWIATMGVLAILAVPIIWPFLREYQQARVIAMFNPMNDPLGSGYHTIQSTIAIGSGGVTGKGWLNGTQSQLDFIPERQTDFVFSVFAEEFGLVGTYLLILAYLFIIWRCIQIARRSESQFVQIVGGTVGVILFLHVFVNIGMVSGILPVVGVPLPLISFGGTSIVALLAGIGIVMGAKSENA